MQLPQASIRNCWLALAFSSIASLTIAILAVRTPGLWAFFPEFVFHIAESSAVPTTQEQAADIEFFVFWLLSFIATVLVAISVFTAAHFQHRDTSGADV